MRDVGHSRTERGGVYERRSNHLPWWCRRDGGSSRLEPQIVILALLRAQHKSVPRLQARRTTQQGFSSGVGALQLAISLPLLVGCRAWSHSDW